MEYEQALTLETGTPLMLTKAGQKIHPLAGGRVGGTFLGCIRDGLIKVRRDGRKRHETYSVRFWDVATPPLHQRRE